MHRSMRQDSTGGHLSYLSLEICRQKSYDMYMLLFWVATRVKRKAGRRPSRGSVGMVYGRTAIIGYLSVMCVLR